MTGALSATAKILGCRGEGGEGENGNFYLMGGLGGYKTSSYELRTIIFNFVWDTWNTPS